MRLCRWLCLALLLVLPGAPVAAQQVSLKIATLAPDGSFWMEEAKLAAARITERSGGRVGLRFYPSGTMGSDDMVLRKMRIGQLHGGAMLVGSLSVVEPNIELYSLPLLFRSDEEVDWVRQRVDQKLLDGLADDGLVAFGLVETGFVYLMSSSSIRTFADLKGRKAWIPEGDQVGKAIVDAAGLAPVPLAVSDVLTGLQTGLIDTVAAPPVGAVALQWFTKAKFVTDLPISYACGALVLAEPAWKRIAAGDQVAVREELTALSERLDRRSRIDNQEAREALLKQGVMFVEPTPETRARWQEVATVAKRTLVANQTYDPSLLTEIERLLADQRSRPQAGSAGD